MITNWGFTLNNVTASWSKNDKNILEKINYKFDINNAKTAALPLMGPSGQGKSTLLYLLAALKLPSEGSVTWRFPGNSKNYLFTKHTAEKKLSEDIVQLRRDHFGFAFQASTLSLHLTVRENIAYPLLLQKEQWDKALKIAEATFDEVLLPSEKVDKKRLLDSFPSQLSGGQQQRAALAQAIVHNPYVLFADEPTGQLDICTRKQVMGVLKQWVAKGQGKRCLIWVTHHHISDLNMMKMNDLLFVKDKACTPRDRQWLKENWINECEE
ncbi:ATP-binding cassette domain-containing protein [Candidatus Parabeggiatoa sp. HSG14]|uniref:ATP-binding cassette domain-containing protein n=1 Tax=Candidatus Parabeggiatoa sp. HSG14 TaxID=3055593 RepID=UPI0025A889CF|nr:ATP-binding cassette domain-containing protein [Thiotrichales bacterium HSG14]